MNPRSPFLSQDTRRGGGAGKVPAVLLSALLAPLFVLAPLSVLSCAREARSEAQKPAALAVRTAAATAVEEPRRITASGSLCSEHEATLTSKIMGAVLEVRCHAGDNVKQGQLLVVIDSRDMAGQVSQARGALAQARAAAVLAETNYHRFEQLFEKSAASQLELDQARYQHETAQGAVAQAEGALEVASSYESYASITAPFNGVVVDRMVEPGDMAAPGRPLVKLEDPGRIRLEATLPETELAAARLGEAVPVQVPSLGSALLQGTVTQIVPAVDPATRSALVKIHMDGDARLRSGLYARAWFAGEPHRVVRIPAEAVLQRGGLTGVIVSEEGRAGFRLITLSTAPGVGADGAPAVPASANAATSEAAAAVEVLSGLSGGEQVVLSPPATLEEGTPLEVAHE